MPVLIIALPFQTQLILKEGVIKGETWQYGTIGIFAFDILVILWAAIFLVTQRRVYGVSNTIWLVTGALWATAFFSVWFSSNRLISWYHVGMLAVGICVMWLFVGWKPRIRELGIAFAISGVIQSILGIMQVLMQKVFSSTVLGMAAHTPEAIGAAVVGTTEGRFLRAYGSFPHPNTLAGFLVICLLLSIGWYLRASARWERMCALAAQGIISAGIVSTFSRSAWAIAAATVLFSGIMIVRYYPSLRRHIIFSLISIGFAASAFGALFYPLVLTRVFGGTRLQLQPVHNTYLLVAAEVSVFGLVFLLLLLFELFKEGIMRTISLPLGSSLALGVLLAVLITGLFDHYYWSLHGGIVVFWASIGAALCLLYGGEKPTGDVDK
ncbi:MAG: hypothetical protein UY34_C0010G0088 [Parcubacteria group bacterium GW2011_GWA2_48_9]|nr:MAG: hypothetical protein UY34_C0010G0088 [Parcubacteria group bacterium GW2011_GWA2_48_9]